MKQYRVEVKNFHEANEAQDLFEKLGYRKGVCFKDNFPKLIITDDEGESTGAQTEYRGGEPITLDQLRTMAKKEYLDENYNLVHHKTDIEVPEGADAYTIGKGFYKNNGSEIHTKDQGWIDATDGYLSAVVWQRTPSVNDEDTVNHPTHYTSGAVECIEAIEASMSAEAFKGFLKGNIIKYTWRYEQKGGAESLEKAQWYLNLLLSRVRS